MKEALALVAGLAVVPTMGVYLLNTLRGKIKPHAITWLIWSVLNAGAALVQITEGAGPGSVLSVVVSIGTFSIFCASLRNGEKNITSSDWLSLIGAILAGGIWIATSEPLLSVVLITLIDAFGSFPTFRKAYRKPNEESLFLFLVSVFAFSTSIAAMEVMQLETVLFPAFIAVSDSLLVAMILWRRTQVISTGLRV